MWPFVMRKLTASFYISLDGVIDEPHEWHFPMVDDAMMSDVAAAPTPDTPSRTTSARLSR